MRSGIACAENFQEFPTKNSVPDSNSHFPMEKSEALQLIRDYLSMDYGNTAIVRDLMQQGIPQSTAYNWVKEAQHVKSDGTTPKDLAIQAIQRVLLDAENSGNSELTLKAAVALARVYSTNA